MMVLITPQELVERRVRRTQRVTFGAGEFVPYVLLAILSVVLVLNVLSTDPGQRAIRPVLVFASIGVVGLVVVRQFLTILDNSRLTRYQRDALERLELANRRIEDQARLIAERNAELEIGVAYLKDVQARLANGNLHARARLTGGVLLPLSASLNLMADRLMRLERVDVYSQQLSRALSDLSLAIERYRAGGPFIIPPSAHDFPEINHLLLAMGLKEKTDMPRPGARPAPPPAGPITQKARTPRISPQSQP